MSRESTRKAIFAFFEMLMETAEPAHVREALEECGLRAQASARSDGSYEEWHREADRLKKCVDYAPTGLDKFDFMERLAAHLQTEPSRSQSGAKKPNHPESESGGSIGAIGRDAKEDA